MTRPSPRSVTVIATSVMSEASFLATAPPRSGIVIPVRSARSGSGLRGRVPSAAGGGAIARPRSGVALLVGKASNLVLEGASAVGVVAEHVERRAGGGKQDRVAGHALRERAADRFPQAR